MDYTEGSLDIKRGGIIDSCVRHIGPPSRIDVEFSLPQLKALAMDTRCYSLCLEPAKQMVEDVTKARRWVKNVYDCENRAFAFVNDIAEFARDHGYKLGVARGVIGYYSDRFKGYHAAAVMPIWNPVLGDAIPWIVEPKVLHDNGVESPAVFRLGEVEVSKWGWVIAPL